MDDVPTATGPGLQYCTNVNDSSRLFACTILIYQEMHSTFCDDTGRGVWSDLSPEHRLSGAFFWRRRFTGCNLVAEAGDLSRNLFIRTALTSHFLCETIFQHMALPNATNRVYNYRPMPKCG